MVTYPRLMRRGVRYYLRAAVPDDLVPIIGKREIWKSLRTADHREAVQRLPLENVRVDAEFAAARRKLAVEPPPVTAISDDELRQIVLSWFAAAERSAVERHAATLGDDPADALENLEGDEAALSDTGDIAMLGTVQQVAREALEAAGVNVDPTSADFHRACDLVHRGMIEAVRRSRDRHTGERSDRAHDAAFHGVGASTPRRQDAPPAPIGITVDALFEKFLADPGRRASSKTDSDYTLVRRLAKELWRPDRAVRSLGREHFRELRDVLTTLPPNAAKRWRGVPLVRVAELAASKGVPPMSAANANKNLQAIAAVWNYALKEDFADRNPAAGLRVAKPETAARDRRLPFSTEQLRLIFSAPLYVGCQDDEHGYDRPGPNHPRRARFWIPLLSLYTGGRLNELCQLLTDDIAEIDGVTSIHVRSDDEGTKRLKSVNARRLVPVHSELVKIGFPAFVAEARRRGDSRLFPELKPGSAGYLSDPFQKFYSRFLEKCGAAQPRTSFHSFRHSWRDALREAGVSSERVRQLGGWAGDGHVSDAYGSGVKPSTLALEIQKIEYPGLDLSHLHL